MSGNSNVELVQRWFEAAATGDLATALAALSPTLHYYGYDTTGQAREFRDRNEFLAMGLQAVELTDEFTTQIVRALPVGDSLVMAHVRARRRAKQSHEAVDDDFVIAFRVEAGQITHGIDLCGPALIEFWKRNGPP